MSIEELFKRFSDDPTWSTFARHSLPSVRSVILRKHGCMEATAVTKGMLSSWISESDQPADRKARVRSCMEHLFSWAKAKGLFRGRLPIEPAPAPAPADIVLAVDSVRQKKRNLRPLEPAEPPTASPQEEPTPVKSSPKAKAKAKTEPKAKAKPKPKPKPKPKAKPKPRQSSPSHDPHQLSKKKLDVIREDEYSDLEQSKTGAALHGWPTPGSVYYDESSNGHGGNADRWVAEFQIGGVHFRYRSKDRLACEQWVKAVRMGRIKPWHNGADWMLTEQRRYMELRYGETIVSNAEEALLLLAYSDTGDISPIMEYMERRLLPHMVYYCCHTLRLGRDASMQRAKEALSLLLTEISAGKPVLGFTRVAKRMLRVRSAHGSFWYYEKAPRDIKLLVDGIDFAPLGEVWKVTRDLRI